MEEVADSQGKVYDIVKWQPKNAFTLNRESPETDLRTPDFSYLSNYSPGKQIAFLFLEYPLRDVDTGTDRI